MIKDNENLLRMPLVEALRRLSESGPISFHVPGHKYAQSIGRFSAVAPDAWARLSGIMAYDVTELSVTDDLHAPSGVIAEAQQLASRCFGSEQSFFLVGGSTAGNMALLLACCAPGDVIIVQRNVHKSVLNGLALAGARAVFLSPMHDADSDMLVVPALDDIEAAITAYPDAKAVVLTNPNYYGCSVDLTPYAELIHRYGKPLLVDEAHGAHYGQHPDFPNSALQAGADGVVQSTHKTLTALTMGAMLHIQGDRLNREAIRHALGVIQSSSPSYPIMASLDIARAMLDVYGPDLFELGLRAAKRLRQWLSASNRYELVTPDSDSMRSDPLRIVLKDRFSILSGFELQHLLEQKGCWAEMADSARVVLIIGLETTDADIGKLETALAEIADRHTSISRETEIRRHSSNFFDGSERISRPVALSRIPVSENEMERIEVTRSAGRISAESVIPYPPGIPILYQGEWISPEMAAYLGELRQMGAKFQGAGDPAMRTIAVFRDRQSLRLI